MLLYALVCFALIAFVVVEWIDIERDYQRYLERRQKDIDSKRETCYDVPVGSEPIQPPVLEDTMEATPLDTRIDYLRLPCRMPVDQSLLWKSICIASLTGSVPSLEGEDNGNDYRFFTVYDRYTKSHVTYFEVWGPRAHKSFYHVPMHYLKDATRVDYRCEVNAFPVSYEYIYKQAGQRAGNKRRSMGMLSSPPRSKKDGRDAGGKGVFIGSRNGSVRVVLYQRGDERPAVEVQMGDKTPQRLYRMALDAADASDTPFGGGEFRWLYLQAAKQVFLDSVFDRTGYSFYQLEGAAPLMLQEETGDREQDPVAMLLTDFQMLSDIDRKVFIQTAIDLSALE